MSSQAAKPCKWDQASGSLYTFIGETQQTAGRPLALTMRSSYCGNDHSNKLSSPYPKGLDWNSCTCIKATAVNQSGFNFISYFKKKANKFNSASWYFFGLCDGGKKRITSLNLIRTLYLHLKMVPSVLLRELSFPDTMRAVSHTDSWELTDFFFCLLFLTVKIWTICTRERCFLNKTGNWHQTDTHTHSSSLPGSPPPITVGFWVGGRRRQGRETGIPVDQVSVRFLQQGNTINCQFTYTLSNFPSFSSFSKQVEKKRRTILDYMGTQVIIKSERHFSFPVSSLEGAEADKYTVQLLVAMPHPELNVILGPTPTPQDIWLICFSPVGTHVAKDKEIRLSPHESIIF